MSLWRVFQLSFLSWCEMNELDFTLPVLPYAGTSGWSGSEASRDRALENDSMGRTTKRQAETMLELLKAKEKGLTWLELGEIKGWHHGTASGVLSVLHKIDGIVRLKEKRNRCSVYVMRGFVNNREISERTIKCCKNCGAKI